MSSKTKIFVFKMRELIYTAIFILLAALLIILLVFMFLPEKGADAPSSAGTYIPGVYTSSITLNNQALDVEVTVDADHINSVRFVSLDDSIATMYPLMESVMGSMQTQILEKQSADSVSYTSDTQYTSMILLEAVNQALDQAKIRQTPSTAS